MIINKYDDVDDNDNSADIDDKKYRKVILPACPSI